MRAFLVFAMIACSSSVGRTGEQRHFAYADAVTFLGTEQAAKAVMRTVFAVQVGGNLSNPDKRDDWRPIGTGFFVQGPQDEMFGVTCAHIVRAAEKLKLPFVVGADTEAGYERLQCRLLVIKDELDIAVVGVLAPKGVDLKVQNLPFSEELFDAGDALVEGRGVLIPGYPLFLGIEDDRNHTVVRMGMIAQNTQRDFFLVDGMASHGNSGSPVFAMRYKGHRLVGMVTAFINDRISLADDGGVIVAQLPYNSGLARVVRASAIRIAVDEAGKMMTKERETDKKAAHR